MLRIVLYGEKQMFNRQRRKELSDYKYNNSAHHFQRRKELSDYKYNISAHHFQTEKKRTERLQIQYFCTSLPDREEKN